MRVFKNLFGKDDKIHACNIVVGDKNNHDLLSDIASESFLQYSSLQKIKKTYKTANIGTSHGIQLDEPANCNNIRTTGLYYLGDNSSTNTPTDSNGYLLVIAANAGHCVQLFANTSTSNTVLYIRKYVNGSGWGGWGAI